MRLGFTTEVPYRSKGGKETCESGRDVLNWAASYFGFDLWGVIISGATVS